MAPDDPGAAWRGPRPAATPSRVLPIIHIGLHKTASSWFQASVYPAASSHRMIDRVRLRQVLLGGTAFDFDPAAARAALDLDAGLPPILCDEDLSGWLHNGGLASAYVAKEVAVRLRATVGPARVVIFVREQAALAAAHYQQYVREGGTYGPRRYLFPENYRHLTKVRPFKTPRFDWSQLDPTGLIAHYDALFGREHVRVFAFEQLRDPGFLTRFAQTVALTATPRGRETVNGSYRTGVLWLARWLNLFTARSVADKRVLVHIPYWYPVRKRLLERLNRWPLFGRVPIPERLLGDDVVRWTRAHFAAANARLAERMGTELAALGYAVGASNHGPARPGRAHWARWLRN